MPLGGPCSHPECSDPERDGGQWQYVPESVCSERGLIWKQACVCKRAACRRWCGLAPPPQKPGRKRAHGEPSNSMALPPPERVPCPPIIVSVEEIWGVRCTSPVQSADRVPSDCSFCCLHRHANVDALDEIARSNKLPFQLSACIEYAVQGKFRRSLDDTNGVHGCWYVPLKKLVRAIGKDDLTPILEAYEHDLAEARAEALEQIDEADESGGE